MCGRAATCVGELVAAGTCLPLIFTVLDFYLQLTLLLTCRPEELVDETSMGVES